MRIWLALLLAPVLALADQSVALSLTTWACAHQQPLAMHAAHLLFMAAAAASTVLAWQAWRGTAGAGGNHETLARRRFLAGVATGSGALSTLVIAAMWAPNWVLSPCFA
jgi:hypothetical protein